jgi:hypothetical protein
LQRFKCRAAAPQSLKPLGAEHRDCSRVPKARVSLARLEDVTMPSPYEFRSVSREFHPEFGYFWPATHTRRIVRIGLAAAAFGALFGAIAVLAMTPRVDTDVARAETVLMATAAESPAAVQTPAPEAIGATGAPAAAQTPAAAAKPCKEQTWPYLDRKCLNGTSPKHPQVRVFRPETPAKSAPTHTVAVTPSDVTAAAHMSEPPVAQTPKQRQKTATRQRTRRDSREVDGRGRYADPRSAYASPYDRAPPPRRDWGWGW